MTIKHNMLQRLLPGLVAGALGFGFFVPAAMAAPLVVQANDKIKFTDGPGAHPGGAFNLTVWDSGGTVVKGSFLSFCLEKNEYINFDTTPLTYSGTTFKVDSITEEAKKGGAGGQIATPYPHDPLDNKTAWLYTNFIENQSALGSLFGALTAEQKGSAMQQAVWKIEQEISIFDSGLGSSVVNAANDLVNRAGTAGWTNTGRVHVLNLSWWSGGGSTYPTGTFAQDQLYIAPVPEPETYAMLLAGLGLLGFAARRRRAASM